MIQFIVVSSFLLQDYISSILLLVFSCWVCPPGVAVSFNNRFLMVILIQLVIHMPVFFRFYFQRFFGLLSCWHLPVAWCFSFSPSLGCCFSLIFDRDLLRHILFLEKHFLEEICILIILVTEFHFEELLFVFYLLFIYYCIVLY